MSASPWPSPTWPRCSSARGRRSFGAPWRARGSSVARPGGAGWPAGSESRRRQHEQGARSPGVSGRPGGRAELRRRRGSKLEATAAATSCLDIRLGVERPAPGTVTYRIASATGSPMPSPIQPLPDQSLADAVADRLREGIHNGEYAPGQRLVERTLSDRLGVSHIPVREALTKLEDEGLVVRLPRRGAR